MSFSHSHFDCPVCGLTDKEIDFYGFSYCNHPICGVCSIKLQKFSKDVGNDYDYSKCVICKQDISKIILASSIKPFESFDQTNLLCDTQYDLLFESTKAESYYKNVIKIKCPKCKMPHNSMDDMILHMNDHKMRYCDLCVTFNKCLHYELEIYSDNDYHQHRYKKHPKCKFCETRFYDDSHLIKHVKDKHFVCDICHRNHGCVAYKTQIELLRHYSMDHFVCEICRSSNNINVFESEYNLKTHKVSVHSSSLVGEGLVTVGFGDNRDNQRYGNRRRQRDEDAFFVDSLPTAMEIPQALPTFNCEQEFPRLGADAVAGSQQLGVPSLTLDRNDARAAFIDQTETVMSEKETNKIQMTTAATSQANVGSSSNRHEKMSDNIAIMVKRSAGSLNSEDFPSLSSSLATGGNKPNMANGKSLKSVLQSSNRVPQTNPGVVEEDFPSLPACSGKSRPGQASKQSVWKPSGKSEPIKRDVVHSRDNVVRVTAVEERPKVSVMSNQEFQQAKIPPVRTHQPVPDAELDFPSLAGNGKPSSNLSTANWARAAPTSAPVAKQPFGNFAIESNSDFPGLSTTRCGNKHNSKSGFAKVASAAASIKQPTTASSVATHVNHASVTKAPLKSELQVVHEHVAPRTPMSLRGIDYIPSAPVKDPLIVLDSKQFSIMKQAKESSTGGVGSNFTLSEASGAQEAEEEFPIMSNRYNGLSSADTSVANGNKKSVNTGKVVPRFASESDFPTLAPSKSVAQKNKKPVVIKAVTEKPKPDSNKSRCPQQPVVSLMDVAMSVGQKSYTDLVDADQRNQNIFTLVTDSLNVDMATQFLQLANLYRTRKLSVHDYLDILQGDSFSGQMEFISRMLPEMCVLLPDIPLQRGLMSSMPKAWIKDLRQCTRCDQVLHKTDLALHNQKAH